MIKFSAKLVQAMISTPAHNTLYVYTGAIPSVDRDFTFSASTYVAQRIATVSVGITIFNVNQYVLTNTPSPVTAASSGTATWFALVPSSAAGNAIISTVGPLGSNAPLQVQNIDAVTGQPFSVVQLSLKITP